MFEVEYEGVGEKSGDLKFKSPFSLIVNNQNIDDVLTTADLTVETVKVLGRQTNTYDIQTVTPPKYNGQMILGKRMTAKPIQVVLMIEADEMSAIKAGMSRLNSMLRKTTVISFKDEADLTYYVEFEGADDPEEGYRQEITLNFLWHKPVKYKSEKTISYSNSQRLSIDSDEAVAPYIELEFADGVKTWSMRNVTTDMNINYEHEIMSNKYQIDLEDLTITKGNGNESAMSGLKTESDFEDFMIEDRNQIVVTPTPTSITIKYEGVML